MCYLDISMYLNILSHLSVSQLHFNNSSSVNEFLKGDVSIEWIMVLVFWNLTFAPDVS